MTRRSETIRFYDFTGGLNTKSSVTSLKPNEALDLQNINILPNGGFEKRRGNTAFNGTAMDSGAAVHGLGFYRQSDGDEWMMAIAGTKLFKSDSLDGTMDDITSTLTITTGADKIWTHAVLNDIFIFAGGNPNEPIKWAGTGNGAVLGGSPPNAEFVLTANNRAFLGNSSTYPSRIWWSILGNPEDWSGTGSGSQDVNANDGDTLVGAAVLNIDHMLLFKQNSIHDLAIRTAPFPLFPLFRNVGAASKRGIVYVDGLVYFITPEPRMKATDGYKIYDFPDTIDDVWDGLSKSRLKYIHGQYYPRLRQIMWFVTNGSGSTHDLCIVWDLQRKCWLRHTTGYKMNVSAIVQDRLLYTGAYDGKIYKQDVADTYTDASETNTAIDAFWRSGWLDFGDAISAKHIAYLDTNFVGQQSGTFNLSYGYDFSQDRSTISINMAAAYTVYGTGIYGTSRFSGQADLTKLNFINGSGKYFQYKLQNATASEQLSVNGISMPVKLKEPRAFK